MKKKPSITTILIVILLLITALSVGVTVWALCFREPDQPLTPDYQPPALEENVEKVEGDGTKLEAPSGGGSIRVEYVDAVTVDTQTNTNVTGSFDVASETLAAGVVGGYNSADKVTSTLTLGGTVEATQTTFAQVATINVTIAQAN